MLTHARLRCRRPPTRNPGACSTIPEWDSRDDIFVATVPELSGCRAHGRTYEDAVQQGQDAIATWLTGEPRATGPAPRDFTARAGGGGRLAPEVRAAYEAPA